MESWEDKILKRKDVPARTEPVIKVRKCAKQITFEPLPEEWRFLHSISKDDLKIIHKTIRTSFHCPASHFPFSMAWQKARLLNILMNHAKDHGLATLNDEILPSLRWHPRFLKSPLCVSSWIKCPRIQKRYIEIHDECKSITGCFLPSGRTFEAGLNRLFSIRAYASFPAFGLILNSELVYDPNLHLFRVRDLTFYDNNYAPLENMSEAAKTAILGAPDGKVIFFHPQDIELANRIRYNLVNWTQMGVPKSLQVKIFEFLFT